MDRRYGMHSNRKRLRPYSRSWRSAETLVQTDNPDDLEQETARLSQYSTSPHTLVRLDSPDDGYIHDPGALGLDDGDLHD